MTSELHRFTYRDRFRSLHYEAFQAWFEDVARAMHAPGDFQRIRVTQGDGGLDGFAIDAQLVYQVYAPARTEEMRDATTAAKVRADFERAHATLGGRLKTWCLVHNHPTGKIGKLTATTISELRSEHPAITLRIFDIDSLWECLEALPEVTLNRLFGTADATRSDVPAEDAIPGDLQLRLDEVKALTVASKYPEASAAVEMLIRDAQQRGSEAAELAARVKLAQLDLLLERNITRAREMMLACLRRVSENDPRRHGVLISLGEAEILLGNIGEARSLFKLCRELSQRQKKRFNEAVDLVSLSRAEELLGDVGAAHRLLDEAVELYRAEYREASGDDKRDAAMNLGACLSTKAHLLRREGRLSDALVYLERAMPLFEESNSRDNLGRMLVFKAEIFLNDARWEDGFETLKVALHEFQTIGNRRWENRCVTLFARLLFHDRQREAGLAATTRVVDSASEPDGVRPEDLLHLASLAQHARAPELAKRCRDAAGEIARQTSDHALAAECLITEAETTDDDDAGEQRRRGLFVQAIQELETALATCEIRGRRAQHMLLLGRLRGWLREVREARGWFERALTEFEALGDVAGTGEALALLSGAAREEASPEEAVAALERLLDLSKGAALPYLRAAALHDLGRIKLTHGKVDTARQYFDEAKALAEKHGLKDILTALRPFRDQLESAESVNLPAQRDLPALLDELHGWCRRHPEASNAILPLWYYMHSTDLWSVCRQQIGVKFLIVDHDLKNFVRAADLLVEQGDLFLFGTNFRLRKQKRTELIPVPSDFLVPAHMRIVFFTEHPSDPAVAARAIVETLGEHAYVMLPFDKALKTGNGATMFAFGRHVRLQNSIRQLMLDTSLDDLVMTHRACLPLAEGDRGPSLLTIMLVGWENGLIPVLWHELPHHGEVRAVRSIDIELPLLPKKSQSTEPDLKRIWRELLRDCADQPDAALAALTAQLQQAASTASDTVEARVYALKIHAGRQEVCHPIVVLKRPNKGTRANAAKRRFKGHIESS
jgi:tetratricopeptide (TPR) repeat protein